LLLALPKNAVETMAFLLLAGGLLALRWQRPQDFSGILPLIAPFALASLKALPALSSLSRARMELLGALPDVEAIDSVLDVAAPPRRAGVAFSGIKRGIRFDGVTFRYEGRTQTLRDISFDIPLGKTVAVIGDSGSGKTTLIHLILGLYEPQKGRIAIDDVSLLELDRRSWLGRLGLVSQETFLSHASIEDNILFGRAGFSRQALERAAKTAQIHEFVAALPEGYATIVGERGLKVSGGQRQRLAIARAVLGDPALLIFDEATSALDGASERAVQDAIAEASRGRTVLQITHRLTAVERADKILVLHEGRVAEEGSHAQLLALGGRYAAMRSLQPDQKDLTG
jgi:ABC-type multidrug transport system fused ATPase/permease subunit